MNQKPTGFLLVCTLMDVGVFAACGSSARVASPSSTLAQSTTTTLMAPTTTTLMAPATTQSATARTVLAPATVAPVSDECTLPLSRAEDSNVSPLLCSGGGVNTLAWSQYARGKVRDLPVTSSQTMQLGANASSTSVLAAMCSDYSKVFGTNPLTISAEKLAAAYYGWSFSDSRVSNFDHQRCSAAQPEAR